MTPPNDQEPSTEAHVVLLPGDGVGPEVTAAAQQVLQLAAEVHGKALQVETALIGGHAMDVTGEPLPQATLGACAAADAVLLGAVGGPKWSDPSASVRPEQGLLELRKHFGLFANLRPVPVFDALVPLAPLRAEILTGTDILFVRELTGGLYFGPRQEEEHGSAYDTLIYSVEEVQRVAHMAFQAARGRRRKVTSVDKANVLASMRLWRRVVEEVAREYPDVELEHCLVDACAMRLLREPTSFDVVLAGNLFGDILSDEAAVLAGSLGMLPSASVGEPSAEGRAFGVYEPIHGSAPDIAGQDRANPIAAILSGAMLARHSLGWLDVAQAMEDAVASALDDGLRTADLVRHGKAIGTEEMTEEICRRL